MSNDKQRMVEIVDLELSEISAGGSCLSVPAVFSQRIGDRIHFFVNADDLRAWREARSQHTSE